MCITARLQCTAATIYFKRKKFITYNKSIVTLRSIKNEKQHNSIHYSMILVQNKSIPMNFDDRWAEITSHRLCVEDVSCVSWVDHSCDRERPSWRCRRLAFDIWMWNGLKSTTNYLPGTTDRLEGWSRRFVHRMHISSSFVDRLVSKLRRKLSGAECWDGVAGKGSWRGLLGSLGIWMRPTVNG